MKNKKKKRAGKIMIRSMTGFGKSTIDCPYGKLTAEIKTLNHKTLSVVCNPFNGMFHLEQRSKTLLDSKIFRGKAFIRISSDREGSQKSLHDIKVNEKVAREYVRKIKKMQKDVGIKGEIHIRDIMELPGVVESQSGDAENKLWPHVKKALEDAVDKLIIYRKREGARLAKDFNARLNKIDKNLKEIKKYGKQSVGEYRKELVQSIRDIAKNTELDKSRLEDEVAVFAKNCDIAEETTRLAGHIVEYKHAMRSVKTDVGKKLDFIAQEMQREANTIGAKASDFRISKTIIEVKSEIEKLREQVKNIE